MLDQTNANIERHIKTHTERSDDDRAAVSVLETFLRSNGRINTSFASDDKWPNHDGTFEFVPNPEISRRPVQTFYVQIKGTRNYTEREGVIKYTLKDLAFPAFICGRVSLDPGILFVILNPAERGDERVFWKYMSPSFLNSIDFAKDSITVSFSPEEEILSNEESVLAFCERLEEIVERHSFVNQLERHSYSFEEAKRIVETCDTEITESIDNLSILNKSRQHFTENSDKIERSMHFSFTAECDERRLSKSQRRLCVGILTLKGKYKVLREFLPRIAIYRTPDPRGRPSRAADAEVLQLYVADPSITLRKLRHHRASELGEISGIYRNR